MSKTIAFIPARCGSKSIPFKNIKPLAGQPLIYWNLSALEESSSVDEVWVATDCDKIENVVHSFGLSKVSVFRRSSSSAVDSASTEDVMLEFLRQKKYSLDDIFMLVQITSPLTLTANYVAALEQYFAGGFDSMLTAVPFRRFLWRENGEAINYDYRHRPRRQDMEYTLLENGAFYLSRVGGILASGNRLNGKIGVFELPEYMSVELDEPYDWVVMEALMSQYRVKEETKGLRERIRVVISDVDGVLTDGRMVYSEHGDELKNFNTRDGMAFELFRKQNIKCGLVTSENTNLVTRRAQKMKMDFVYQGKKDGGKAAVLKEIAQQAGCSLHEIVYVGDDVNCIEALKVAGFAACPSDADMQVQKIPGVFILESKGGDGVIRELYNRFFDLAALV